MFFGCRIACEFSVEMQSAQRARNIRRSGWLASAGRGLIGLALLVCLLQTGRATVASWVARRESAEALQSAERWDPSNPDYPEQLGRALAAEGADAAPAQVARAFEDSAGLAPHRAANWTEVAEALDFSGDASGAARAYGRALKLFPKSPAINWQFANFEIRAGDAAAALEPLQTAIAGDASLRTGAFDLAWRAGIPPEEILEMLPARQEILSAYLDFLVATGRLDAAAGAWRRLIAPPERFDLDAAFRYFDAELRARDVDALTRIWSDLGRHDPDRVHTHPDDGNRITNGGFEDAIVNGGFDWRIVPTDGAQIGTDASAAHDGARSLAVHFDGTLNLDFGSVAECVAVEANTAYRLSAYTRSEEITTDTGPRIAVYDAFDHAALWIETGNVTGTTSWQEQRLDFRTGPKTRLLIVQLVRRPSGKFDNKIAGTVWLDDVSLRAAR